MGALYSWPLFAQKAFEDRGGDISWQPTLDSPTDTLAALTDWGQQINHVYLITTIVTILVFFAVAIPLCYTLYRFKAKSTDSALPKQFHGNTLLEFVWTVVPIILLIFIAVPTWRAILGQSKAPSADALKIKVIGHQWWWEFQYPDFGIVTANQLHLPENTPVEFEITSADVIHSFWVPKFAGKIDAMPGKTNRMSLTTPAVTELGASGGDVYRGVCVELCGASHALMRFLAVVHSQDEFDSWVKTHNTPPVIATKTEKKGEGIFNTQCMACHSIYGTPSADMPIEKIGPDLTNFGSRFELGAGTRTNTVHNLQAWIDDPPSIKPNSLMQPLGLSEGDRDAVIAYLRNSTIKQYSLGQPNMKHSDRVK